jgi:hypothetical protein
VSHDQSSPGTGQAAPQRTAPESTRSTLDTDGMLSEWGARLFYPTPKGKGGQGGVGAGQLPLFTAVAALTAAMSPNEVCSGSALANRRTSEACCKAG